MPAKKATKTANIVAVLYDGKFDVTFECVGVTQCMYVLCYTMPPDGNDPCVYCHHGSCGSIQAQIKALALIKNKLTYELNKREETEESA